MNTEDRAHFSQQEERLLKAFLAAEGRTLTTGQLEEVPLLANWRARMSALRKQGHAWRRVHIEGTHSHRYTYLGLQFDPAPEEPKYLTTISLGGHDMEVYVP